MPRELDEHQQQQVVVQAALDGRARLARVALRHDLEREAQRPAPRVEARRLPHTLVSQPATQTAKQTHLLRPREVPAHPVRQARDPPAHLRVRAERGVVVHRDARGDERALALAHFVLQRAPRRAVRELEVRAQHGEDGAVVARGRLVRGVREEVVREHRVLCDDALRVLHERVRELRVGEVDVRGVAYRGCKIGVSAVSGWSG